MDTVARLFMALADALGCLQDYYLNVDIASPEERRNCIFPERRSYPGESGCVQFKYLSQLFPDQKNKAIFKALTSDGRTIIVKFTDRYNATAHRLVAASNLAPQLLFCSSEETSEPSIGYIMVVMEFLEGKTVGERFAITSDGHLKGPSGILKNVSEDVYKAIRILHNAGLVFADLRPPNIMVVRDRAKLVDFDWCDLDGEASYRGDLNVRDPSDRESLGSIKWHPEVERGGVMRQKHDIWMAEQLFHILSSANSIEEE